MISTSLEHVINLVKRKVIANERVEAMVEFIAESGWHMDVKGKGTAHDSVDDVPHSDNDIHV